MDSLQSVGSVSGIVSVISIIIYGVYQCCQHFHCGSKCCGAETSLDVDLGENRTKDESVYLKLKNFIPRRTLQSSSSSKNDPKKVSFLSPPPPPNSPSLSATSSSTPSAQSLEELEHHVRF